MSSYRSCPRFASSSYDNIVPSWKISIEKSGWNGKLAYTTNNVLNKLLPPGISISLGKWDKALSSHAHMSTSEWRISVKGKEASGIWNVWTGELCTWSTGSPFNSEPQSYTLVMVSKYNFANNFIAWPKFICLIPCFLKAVLIYLDTLNHTTNMRKNSVDLALKDNISVLCSTGYGTLHDNCSDLLWTLQTVSMESV